MQLNDISKHIIKLLFNFNLINIFFYFKFLLRVYPINKKKKQVQLACLNRRINKVWKTDKEIIQLLDSIIGRSGSWNEVWD